MPVASFLRPWAGFAFRHIPAGSPYDVLDFRFAGLAANNRWSYPGQPTLYLASDPSVALAEFARHLRDDRSSNAAAGAVERALFRLHVTIEEHLDLRNPALLEELALHSAPTCFLDRTIARAVAEYLRRTTPAQALLAPAMAFLDDPDRWILVLFLEKLPMKPGRFVNSVQSEGSFRVSLDPLNRP
ncbi:MAG: hypothetical protein HW416_2456 [Chloroflexi bacterium]|nr:hypothetical protein [Chloroflexota bacterium]